MALGELQRTFAAAVLGGEATGIARLVVPNDQSPLSGVEIHRRNYVGALTTVLANAYPVVQTLFGERRFRTLAAAYVRAKPPRRPQLRLYGKGLARFLAASDDTKEGRFVADLAHFEWALHEAYFAAEADALAPSALQSVPFEQLPAVRVQLHPSARLLALNFDVLEPWQHARAGQRIDAEADAAAGGRQHILVIRDADGIGAYPLGRGEFALLRALEHGAPVQAAADQAMAAQADFALQTILAAHLTRGTFVGYTTEQI